MQFIEASIIGLRSAVITLKHQMARPRIMLFPMVHVGEQAFYDEVAARVRRCQLIVAEGAPPQGYIGRFLANQMYQRDEQLIRVLSEIHRDRSAEPGTVAVVYGAAHIPAAAGYLTETLRYHVEHAEWLMVANAPS
jgi:hypothetical protein